MRIVVVSPHRDDAAFSCGLAIDAWLATGHDVTILNCFTRSEYAPFTDLDTVHANDRESFVTALRLREDRNWFRMLSGRVHMQDMVLRDAPLRLRIPAIETQSTPPRDGDRAVRRIRQALEQLGPELIVMPLAIGGHIDHLTAREAAIPDTNSGIAAAFYEDLPYAARLSAEDTVEAHALALDRTLTSHPTAPAGLPPEAAAARKRRMALCYDSQIADSTADEMASYILSHQGHEHLWCTPGTTLQ